MASWMSAFRKRQKTVLVVLGIVCMFGFVIGPSLMDGFGGSGGPQDPVVVTTRYGKLRESDLAGMQRARATANRCVYELVVAAAGPQAFAQLLQSYENYFG